jgi:hypothetical protein
VALCCAILQDELVAVTLGQEKREQKKKKKGYTTSRNLRLVVATLYELLPLHFAIQAGISLIFRLQVAGCDVAQAGFLTLTFRLFELV